MNGWQECYRGLVFPLHCDHLDHANNRWYAHFFDDAIMAFWSQNGLIESTFEKKLGCVAVQVKTEIEFHHELKAGDQFVVHAAFTRTGAKSITCMAKLTNAETGIMCAAYTGICVFLDRETGKSVAIPGQVREIIEKVLVPE